MKIWLLSTSNSILPNFPDYFLSNCHSCPRKLSPKRPLLFNIEKAIYYFLVEGYVFQQHLRKVRLVRNIYSKPQVYLMPKETEYLNKSTKNSSLIRGAEKV